MARFCKDCSVSCPSEYNWQQHIAGKKHAAVMARRSVSAGKVIQPNAVSAGSCGKQVIQPEAVSVGGSSGSPVQASKACFYWPQGSCFKGASCPFFHDPKAAQPSQQRRFLQDDAVVTGEFILTKLASSSSSSSAPTLPSSCRDILKGKQDVNLYLIGGRVVWQFKYDAVAIQAIKEHVPDRKWEPDRGAKGCWTAPILSLPACIALYEHFGRKPDVELKQRAKEVVAQCGADAGQAVTLKVELTAAAGSSAGVCDGASSLQKIGRVIVTFVYNADVVAAIKQLPPIQRAYDATTRAWPVDLLALPELLSHLQQEAGYAPPSAALSELSEACATIDELLHARPTWLKPAPPKPATEAAKEAQADPFSDGLDDALCSLDVDALIASQSSQRHAADQENASQQCAPCMPTAAAEEEPERRAAEQAAAREAAAREAAAREAAAEAAAAEEAAAREATLEEALQTLVRLVRHKEGVAAVDASDVGRAKKKRKLTAAQKAFARGESVGGFDDDSDDSVGGYGGSYGGGFLHAALNILRSYRRDAPPPPRAAPAGCECGQFWRLTAGRHVCRYFGHFQCGACANRWTSAYCWQGEKQECKRCGANNLPHKKEPLDGRAGTGTGRPHDSSRCGMCKRLGRDCSLA